MHRILLLVFSLFAVRASAGGVGGCEVVLHGGNFRAVHAEFTRRFVATSLPSARAVTVTPLAHVEQAVASLGLSAEDRVGFRDLVANGLALKREARGPALARAVSALAEVRLDGERFSVCLLDHACADDVLFAFVSRDVDVRFDPRKRPSATYANAIYAGVDDAPNPHGFLFLAPEHYRGSERQSALLRSLVRTMSTFAVMTAVRDWARANAGNIAMCRVNGLLGYVSAAKGAFTFNVGFAQLLTLAQAWGADLQMSPPGERVAREWAFARLIHDHYPTAWRLAKKLKIDGSAGEIIAWSERAMREITGGH